MTSSTSRLISRERCELAPKILSLSSGELGFAISTTCLRETAFFGAGFPADFLAGRFNADNAAMQTN